MDVTWESHLLSLYMQDYIDSRRPVTLEFQLKVWREHGFIHEGYTDSNFMSFETWKRIREMFPNRWCFKWMEIRAEDLVFIDQIQINYSDIFKSGGIPIRMHNPILIDPACHI